MATKQAAMPDALWKNSRRETPCLLAIASAMPISRASTSFCCGVCGEGRYSSLETTWVGTGEGKAASSAPVNWLNSSSFRKCTHGLQDWASSPHLKISLLAFGGGQVDSRRDWR